jgi:hypothetical protein
MGDLAVAHLGEHEVEDGLRLVNTAVIRPLPNLDLGPAVLHPDARARAGIDQDGQAQQDLDLGRVGGPQSTLRSQRGDRLLRRCSVGAHRRVTRVQWMVPTPSFSSYK